MDTKRKEYGAVDIIKFICAIFVIAIHVSPFGYNGTLGRINYFCVGFLAKIAVPFFFIASGFFLYRKTPENEFTFNPTKKFLKKMLKLYLLWSLIYLYFPIKIILESGDIKRYAISYVRDFIFIGSYAHLWYLNASIVAVFLVSVLLKFKVKIRFIVIIAILLYVLGLLTQSWYGIIRPLENKLPQLWKVFRLARKILVSAKDGLFEGFVFISIGMFFAYDKIKLNLTFSIIGFIVSLVLLYVEIDFVNKHGYARESVLYIFLVPAAMFLFAIGLNVKTKERKVYTDLRLLSSLIYYLHYFWFKILDLYVFKNINLDSMPGLLYVSTLVITLLTSVLIMVLSRTKHGKFLKHLYS